MARSASSPHGQPHPLPRRGCDHLAPPSLCRSPFSDPDIAIGHSYSLDGLTWYSAALPAANSSILYEGLGVVVHGKRERPHLYLDDNGNIAALVRATCRACRPLPSLSHPPRACACA